MNDREKNLAKGYLPKNNSENYYNKLMNELDNMDNISELDEEQVLKIKEKFKKVESSLKEKIKPKTITISGPTHNKIKAYCIDNELNIGEWTENTLVKELDRKPQPAPKRLEVKLINGLKEYSEKLIKFYRRPNFDKDISESLSIKKNIISEAIWIIKNELWEERNRTKTIKVDLEKRLQEFDTSGMSDSILRKYSNNLFVIYFYNRDILKKVLNKKVKEGEIFMINDKGTVTFKNYYAWDNKCKVNINDDVNYYSVNSMVFEFNKETFDFDIPIEAQIKQVFDIQLSPSDYFMGPIYHEDKDAIRRDNDRFDVASILRNHDPNSIYKKKKDRTDFLMERYEYPMIPVLLKVSGKEFGEKMLKELSINGVTNKYKMTDSSGKPKRVFAYINDQKMTLEKHNELEQYKCSPYGCQWNGYPDCRNIVEILGFSIVDDDVIVVGIKYEEFVNGKEKKETFLTDGSISGQLNADISLLVPYSLKDHI